MSASDPLVAIAFAGGLTIVAACLTRQPKTRFTPAFDAVLLPREIPLHQATHPTAALELTPVGFLKGSLPLPRVPQELQRRFTGDPHSDPAKHQTLKQPTVKFQTYRIPTVKVPTRKHPLPTLKVPTVKVATLKIPTIKHPTLKLPTIKAPTVKVATLKVPTLKVPTLNRLCRKTQQY